MKELKKPSLLYVPGSSENMLGKIPGIDAGGFILDLEDSVAASEKEAARARVAEFLKAGNPRKFWVAVRVNLMTSAYGAQDFLTLAALEPDMIIIPKAREADMITAQTLLEGLEEKAGRKLETGLAPLVESAYSVERIYEILASSPRISAAQFGAEDFTKDMGIRRTKAGAEVAHARWRLSVACRAVGIPAIDSPFTDYSDESGHEADCVVAREMGYEAKTCIHPKQITMIHKAFLPSIEQIEEAKKIIEAFEAAQREGKGAVGFGGKMLDLPVVERARRLLDKIQ